jgi:hypothetical protein
VRNVFRAKRECDEVRRRTSEVSNVLGTNFTVPKSVSLYLAVNNDKSMERMIADTLDETCGDRAADPQ